MNNIVDLLLGIVTVIVVVLAFVIGYLNAKIKEEIADLQKVMRPPKTGPTLGSYTSPSPKRKATVKVVNPLTPAQQEWKKQVRDARSKLPLGPEL